MNNKICNNCGKEYEEWASVCPYCEFDGNSPEKNTAKIVISIVSTILLLPIVVIIYKYYNNNLQTKRLKEYENLVQQQSNKAHETISQMMAQIRDRMRKIDSLKNDMQRYRGMSDSDIVITRSGEFIPAGLAVYQIQKMIDSENMMIESEIEKIKTVAIQNNVQNQTWFIVLLNQLGIGDNSPVYKTEGPVSNHNMPEPTPADIAQLTMLANSLREKIHSLPRQSLDGDPQYNAVVNNAIGNAIRPLANQFNAESHRFAAIYGRDTLIRVAKENGFFDLLP